MQVMKDKADVETADDAMEDISIVLLEIETVELFPTRNATVSRVCSATKFTETSDDGDSVVRDHVYVFRVTESVELDDNSKGL